LKSLAGYTATAAPDRNTTGQGYYFAAILAKFSTLSAGHTALNRCDCVERKINGVILPHLFFGDVTMLNGIA